RSLRLLGQPRVGCRGHRFYPRPWALSEEPTKDTGNLTDRLSDRSNRRTLNGIERPLKTHRGYAVRGQDRLHDRTTRLIAAVLVASMFGVVGLMVLGDLLLVRMRRPATSVRRAWRVFGVTTLSTGLSAGLLTTLVLLVSSKGEWDALLWAPLLGGLV